MTEDDKKEKQGSRITEKQRMRYIGFEVFPGEPKDLFKSESDKARHVDEVIARRKEGEVLRSDCTLLEPRVSRSERIVMAIASLVIIAALLLPWYSAYTEIVEEPMIGETGPAADSALVSDSALLARAALDTTLIAEETPVDEADLAAVTVEGEAADTGAAGMADMVPVEPEEEILTSHMARASVHREYRQLSGLGAFAALGSVGSHVFSSGAVLVFTGIIFLLYAILCLLLPLFTLYVLFGMKGNADQTAILLKKYLRLNWVPILLFVFALVISFLGAQYGPGTVGTFTSIGDSYGPAVFLGSLSWGVFVSMAAFILVAVKGIEI